jgi:hypothetical protein
MALCFGANRTPVPLTQAYFRGCWRSGNRFGRGLGRGPVRRRGETRKLSPESTIFGDLLETKERILCGRKLWPCLPLLLALSSPLPSQSFEPSKTYPVTGAQLNRLESDLLTAKAELQKLRLESTELQTKLTTLRSELTTSSQALTEAQAQLTTASTSLQTLSDEASAWRLTALGAGMVALLAGVWAAIK